jgi:hypothetical protein
VLKGVKMDGIICDTPKGRIFVAKESSVESVVSSCGFDIKECCIRRKSLELDLNKPLNEQQNLPSGVGSIKIEFTKK